MTFQSGSCPLAHVLEFEKEADGEIEWARTTYETKINTWTWTEKTLKKTFGLLLLGGTVGNFPPLFGVYSSWTTTEGETLLLLLLGIDL
jgi:hypothetical protein